MPSCKDVTEHASDYLERSMTPMQRLGYRMHLFMCVNCKRYVSQLKLTIATLGKIDSATPQPVNEQQVQSIVEALKKQTGSEDTSS
ncbi:zf-HC2 domain-containing protein [Kaarinaea lacus]